MKFKLIPPGEFLMGFAPQEADKIKDHVAPENYRPSFVQLMASASPLHKVRITRPFYIQTYEVTNGQYQKIMGSLPENNDANRPELPLLRDVKLIDAVQFCDELSRKEGKTPAHQISGDRATRNMDANGYRLPTEAEWEYTCRAGTTNLWFFGNDLRIAADRTLLHGYQSVYADALVLPNSFGLFDQYGGSTEWCFDRYARYGAEAITDPFEQPGHSGGIARGGNMFSDGGTDVSTINSVTRLPGGVNSYFGLGRVVLPIEMPEPTVSSLVKEPQPKAPAVWTGWSKDSPAPAIARFDAAKAKTHQEAWAKHLGVPVEYTNSIGMKFALIPPGEFMMGSSEQETKASLDALPDDSSLTEDAKQFNGYMREWRASQTPPRRVRLTQPRYLGIHEVTQGQYEQVMGTNPSCFVKSGPTKELADRIAGLDTRDFPVDSVNWQNAAEFCNRLSEAERLSPCFARSGEDRTWIDGMGYRLPSEAEWEFSCRAGTTTQFWSGNAASDVERVDWIWNSTHRRFGIPRPEKVGALPANPFGLCDLHGNVNEWVYDGWDKMRHDRIEHGAAIDPLVHVGAFRIMRGGVFDRDQIGAGSAARFGGVSAFHNIVSGFRASLSVEAAKAVLASGKTPFAASTGKLFMHDPAFPQWVKDVQAMPAEKQLEAFSKKLMELNPGFDGKLLGPAANETPLIENDVVTALKVLTAKVTDISPVRALLGLKVLTCTQGILADLSPLSGMRLTELYLHFSPELTDLSPLSGMPLTILNLHGTAVSDLSPIKGLPLTKLVLRESRVTDVTPLKGMPLTFLDCLGTRIPDLSPLEGMPLTTLSTPVDISNLVPLKNLPLTLLELHSDTVVDLSPISKMPLLALSINVPKVSDLKPLTGMKLNQLAIHSSQVSDLTPLKGMPLTALTLGTSPVTDLSLLKELPLVSLSADFRPKANTEILRSHKTLQRINDKSVIEFWKEFERK